MAYEPTTWKTGDVVTSAKLNKLEQGVAAGGAFMIPTSYEIDAETGDVRFYIHSAEATAGAIAEASPMVCFAIEGMPDAGDAIVYEWIETDGSDSSYQFIFTTKSAVFTASSASDVPSGGEKDTV